MSNVEETLGSERAQVRAGLLLAAAAFVALLCANLPIAGLYDAILNAPVTVRAGPLAIDKPAYLWINDGLMAVFFLMVGLEIKRELMEGELDSLGKAALPGIAALGGFVLPAAIFALIVGTGSRHLDAWAIPTATDIAFAVGIAALLGRRVPASLKVFLLALAIIDDLMGILVIALFYTASLSGLSLGLAMIGLLGLLALNLRGVQSAAPYVVVGIFTWVCVLKSGVHATLAGVAIGLAMPLRDAAGGPGLLHRAEHGLQPWVGYGIVPLFAFANAGVPLARLSPATMSEALPLGIAAGLFIGKQAGVFTATWLAVRAGLAPAPAGATWIQVYGVALLTGIGFTMSLFIGTLAVAPEQMNLVRLGVLAGSLASGIAGASVLILAGRSSPEHMR